MRLNVLLIGLTTLLATLTGCATQKGGQQPMTADARLAAALKAIEELRQRDIAASKAFDVETLASLWTDDIVVLPPGELPVTGKAAARLNLEKSARQNRDTEIVEYNQDWMETRVLGDYAFEWGIISGTVRAQGEGRVRYRFKVMRLLRREADGSWKVCRTIWNNAPLDSQPQG